MDNFINFNPAVGPGQMLILGYPGSGKSVHATSIAIRALARGEMGLMPGDITCEWRHFLNYPKYVKKVQVLVPETTDIDYINVPMNLIKKINFYEMNLVDYLEPGVMTVVYDDCFDSTAKTLLWGQIFEKIVFRKVKHDKTICYLNHEAGITFPQSATKDQWKYIDWFSEIFVFFRKTGIRAMLLSQIETEIYSRVREKCIWRIYRLAVPGKHSIGRVVRKYVKRMTRDQYHIFYGDLYVPLNSNPKIKEINEFWKMIPSSIITLKTESPTNKPASQNDLVIKIIKKAIEKTGSNRKAAEYLGIDRGTVNKVAKVIV